MFEKATKKGGTKLEGIAASSARDYLLGRSSLRTPCRLYATPIDTLMNAAYVY